MKTRFTCYLTLAATLAASLSIICKAESPTRPNIIFILTDDLGWGDLGVTFQNSRAPGKATQMTPHLDAFAAEGARLTNHYSAAPVCAPSRGSFLTGLSQGHANVRDNQFDKALDNNHTLASVLRQAGYATSIIGKWGLQGAGRGNPGPATWPAYPTKRGFDQFFGYVRHKDGHEHYPKEGPYGGSKEVWDGDHNVTPDLDKCYTADLWTARAKHWIADHEKSKPSQPFFLFLAYDTPHAVTELPTQAYPDGGGLNGGIQWLGTPGHMINTASGTIDSWIHPDYLKATYDDDADAKTPEIAWPDVYQRYATSIRRIDDAIADLTTLLKDLHIDDDTLVIFSSDNGPSIESYLKEPLRADFFESFGPFDGIKRDCLEGGLRVPTLARWPGHIPAGKTIDRPSINYDWMRTFAEAAGVPAPARADGVSLLPELTGQPGQQDKGYLYVEYSENGKTPGYQDFTPAHRNRKRGQMQAIRMGDFMGVRYNVKSQTDPFEIYQVTTDPKEAHNLASTLPELQDRMKAASLQARRPDASAPRPYDKELVSALADVPLTEGVNWQVFEGDFPWVPDFETLKPTKAGTAEVIDLTNLPTDRAAGLFFSGCLEIPRDGDYTFRLTTDGGALLRIHDAIVIDADRGKKLAGTISLKQGMHPFRLYYNHQKESKAELNLTWQGPEIEPQSIPAASLHHTTASTP